MGALSVAGGGSLRLAVGHFRPGRTHPEFHHGQKPELLDLHEAAEGYGVLKIAEGYRALKMAEEYGLFEITEDYGVLRTILTELFLKR